MYVAHCSSFQAKHACMCLDVRCVAAKSHPPEQLRTYDMYVYMRLYGCCSAGAGRRAEPSLLLGVWLRAVLLESHTVLVHDQPGRCFPDTVHRLHPFGEGMSRMSVSFASLGPARERGVRKCTARVRTWNKRGFSYTHLVRHCERSETSAADVVYY